MERLENILEIIEETDTTIIIKVKEGHQLDLITYGFNPDTSLFRCYGDKYCKSFTSYFKDYNEGNTFEFEYYGTTMVSDSFRKQRDTIYDYLKSINKNIWK